MAVALQTKRWTLEEVHSLPDDGNKYELVRGELFVTPPPGETHEFVLARLTAILVPYVARHSLGHVLHPRAVMRFAGSEVEPDLMVRQPKSPGARDWDDAPTPILIVETLSASTRRRDFGQKRDLYVEAGVEEYWIIDTDARVVTRIRTDAPDQVLRDRMTWQPRAAPDVLAFDVASLFD